MTWIHYLLQVNIYLVIFYAFYKLLLDKETYFTLNRIYLITAGTLSLLIPFIRPEWFVKQQATYHLRVSVDQFNAMIAEVAPPDQFHLFSWGTMLFILYGCGVLFFTLRFIYRLLGVRKLLNASAKGMAFSFFHKKVVDGSLRDQEIIHHHEEIHVRQLHTLDVLFFEVIGVVNWCNPVIYFYKNTIKNIHEYLADEAAASFQGDKERYAILLLSKAFGVDQNVLTNSFFNKSLIKKRIFMLHKQRSKKTAILKYGLFLPLFAITLLLSSATIRENEELKDVAEKIAVPAIEVITKVAEKPAAVLVNTPPPVSGQDDWKELYAHIAKEVKYPATALKEKLQGNSVVSFTISGGQIKGLTTTAALGSGCDAEVIRTVSNYGAYDTAPDGKYSLKVAFRSDDFKTPVKNANAVSPKGYTALQEVTVFAYGPVLTIEKKEDKVFSFLALTKQPSFPGGMDNLFHYIAKSVKYPEEALKNNIQGKVFLSFIVETSGQITNVKVERALGGGTDEEAVRLLEASPKWDPGYVDNTPVRVKYNLPIGFKLNNGTTSEKSSAAIDERGHLSGENQPIIIVDGVRTSKDFDVKTIKPDDIESINVLKGSSATSTYGEDAKNGVLLITTKKGKKAGSAEKVLTIEKKN